MMIIIIAAHLKHVAPDIQKFSWWRLCKFWHRCLTVSSVTLLISNNALINLRAALAGRSGGKQSNGQALSISCSKVMVMMMSLPPWSLFASISLSLIIARSALHGKQQVDPTLVCFVSRGSIAWGSEPPGDQNTKQPLRRFECITLQQPPFTAPAMTTKTDFPLKYLF